MIKEIREAATQRRLEGDFHPEVGIAKICERDFFAQMNCSFPKQCQSRGVVGLSFQQQKIAFGLNKLIIDQQIAKQQRVFKRRELVVYCIEQEENVFRGIRRLEEA